MPLRREARRFFTPRPRRSTTELARACAKSAHDALDRIADLKNRSGSCNRGWGIPFAITEVKLMDDLLPKTGMTVSKALRQAMSLLWFDILVTLAVLAAVASRF